MLVKLHKISTLTRHQHFISYEFQLKMFSLQSMVLSVFVLTAFLMVNYADSYPVDQSDVPLETATNNAAREPITENDVEAVSLLRVSEASDSNPLPLNAAASLEIEERRRVKRGSGRRPWFCSWVWLSGNWVYSCL